MSQHVQILFYKRLKLLFKAYPFLYNHVLLCDLFDKSYSFKILLNEYKSLWSKFQVFVSTEEPGAVQSQERRLQVSFSAVPTAGTSWVKGFWFNKRESGMIFFKSWQKLTCYHRYCHWYHVRRINNTAKKGASSIYVGFDFITSCSKRSKRRGWRQRG